MMQYLQRFLINEFGAKIVIYDVLDEVMILQHQYDSILRGVCGYDMT